MKNLWTKLAVVAVAILGFSFTSCVITSDISDILTPTITVNELEETCFSLTSALTITGSVYDGSGVEGLYIKVNDGEYALLSGTADTESGATVNFTTDVTLVSGKNTVSFKATDKSDDANENVDVYTVYYTTVSEGEPNDTYDDGDTLSVSVNLIKGDLTSTDVDYFRSSSTSAYLFVGTTYVFETMPIIGEDDVDTTIELYWPNNTTSASTDDDSGEGLYSKITFTPTGATGGSDPFHVAVAGRYTTSVGAYAFVWYAQ